MRMLHLLAPVLALMLTIACPVLAAPRHAPQTEGLIPLYVEDGANLIHIARDYCRQKDDWKIIAQINDIKPPYLIYRDSYLRVPLQILVIEQLRATVASVHGEVRLLAAGDQPVPLKTGDFLLPGQTITTGPNGRAHLVLPNHAYTRIEPDSSLTMVSLFTLKNGALKVDFVLHQGAVTHRLLKKLRATEQFHTETPISITGVRGTEYRLKTTDPTANIVETLSGRVAVSGQNGAGPIRILPPGHGLRVTRDQGPGQPRLLPAAPASPVLDPLYRSLPVQITAPAHPAARTIRLRITTDEQGQATVFDQQAAPGAAWTVDHLADGQMYAFLTAINADLFESAVVGPLPFRLRTLPATPITASPQNGATLWGSRLEASWLTSEQTDHYEVEVATDKDFTRLVEQKRIDSAHHASQDLQPGAYFFRVRAIAPDGFATTYSAPIACTLVPEPEFKTSQTSRHAPPSLQWPSMGPGWKYDVQVARDRDFTRLVIDRKKQAASTCILQRELRPDTYFVRIRGIGKDARSTAWSQPQTLTIAPSWKPLLLGAGLLIAL